MDRRANIISAIEGFSNWERPWEFFSAVSSSPVLSDEDRAELEKIWAFAAEKTAWMSCKDLSEGCANATAKLAASYPWLPKSALSQLVNGAAYQWR